MCWGRFSYKIHISPVEILERSENTLSKKFQEFMGYFFDHYIFSYIYSQNYIDKEIFSKKKKFKEYILYGIEDNVNKGVKSLDLYLRKKWSAGKPKVSTASILSLISRYELYDEISGSLGIPYIPHVLRIPIAYYKSQVANNTLDGLVKKDEKQSIYIKSLARSLLNRIEERISNELKEELEGLKDFKYLQEYSVASPIVFQTIIQDCKKPEDIIDEAIEMRKSISSKRFRKKIRQLEICLREYPSIKKIEEIAKLFSVEEKSVILPESEKNWIFRFTHGLESILPIIDTEIMKSAIEGVEWIMDFWKKPHQWFLHSIENKAREATLLSKSIERVFGKNVNPDYGRKMENLMKLKWEI